LGGPILKNLGGSHVAGAALRMGIVGAVYEGVLTPSNAKSDHFFTDRMTSALVGGTTFASMGAAAYKLNSLGLFARPASRSLIGSMGFGALSALPAGVAHAEANALFKEDHLLPSAANLFGDIASFAAFGAAYGAIGYGYGRYVEHPLHQSKSPHSSEPHTHKVSEPSTKIPDAEIETHEAPRSRTVADVLSKKFRTGPDKPRVEELFEKPLTIKRSAQSHWARSDAEASESATRASSHLTSAFLRTISGGRHSDGSTFVYRNEHGKMLLSVGPHGAVELNGKPLGHGALRWVKPSDSISITADVGVHHPELGTTNFGFTKSQDGLSIAQQVIAKNSVIDLIPEPPPVRSLFLEGGFH
jgi:hypothetical protein